MTLRADLNQNISALQTFIDRFVVPKHNIRPSVGWFARQPGFIGHLQRNTGTRTYTRQDFWQFIPQCDEIIANWRTATDDYLLELVQAACFSNVEKSALELATTFFGCVFCDEVISYPEVLVHGCFSRHVPVSQLTFSPSLLNEHENTERTSDSSFYSQKF